MPDCPREPAGKRQFSGYEGYEETAVICEECAALLSGTADFRFLQGAAFLSRYGLTQTDVNRYRLIVTEKSNENRCRKPSQTEKQEDAMLFQDKFDSGESLELQIANYETDSGEEKNWLVLRGTWRRDGDVVKGSCPCLLTYELRELTAGLKVLNAGLKSKYESDFASPFLYVSAVELEGDRFGISATFSFPESMDGDDTAEIAAELDKASMRSLIDELDRLCARFPDRA